MEKFTVQTQNEKNLRALAADMPHEADNNDNRSVIINI